MKFFVLFVDHFLQRFLNSIFVVGGETSLVLTKLLSDVEAYCDSIFVLSVAQCPIEFHGNCVTRKSYCVRYNPVGKQ